MDYVSQHGNMLETSIYVGLNYLTVSFNILLVVIELSISVNY